MSHVVSKDETTIALMSSRVVRHDGSAIRDRFEDQRRAMSDSGELVRTGDALRFMIMHKT
jgi:hypothetical protein